MLKRGLSAKLILVSAPAGAGKSTLLAAWLKQQSRPAAWLSLEPGDNDLGRFLLYLVSALQQLEPKLGLGLPELLQQQSLVNAEPLLIRLTNDLAQLEDNLILVLDDYHTVSDDKIHDAVEFLLDHLPPQLCLVIATRTDPPLSLSRLRVRNQLLEVRRADLRFDMSETTHFLNNRLGLELSPTAITSLAARTEGWIAALQLAALSLTGRPDKEAFVEAFAGSHRFLVDYLVDEVLSRQPTQMQAFLQRTAILERFTAPLCEAVTGQPTSADLLERLEAANLFLIPLDDERRWYRFHHLFAEFLQHRLKDAEAERMPELHRRASAWFEGEGWTDEAIRHAFLAADDNLAARLVDDAAAELALHWHNKQLIEYFQQLPSSLLPFYPRLCIFCCWAMNTTGQLSTLATVLPLLKKSRAHARRPRTVDAAVVTLRAYERLRKLDFADATRLCQQALSLLEPREQESTGAEEQWVRVAATLTKAYVFLHSDPRQAAALYPVGLALSQKYGIPVGVANGSARLARVKQQLGQLHEAADVLRQGLITLKHGRSNTGKSGGVGNVAELHVMMGRLHYEWNRLGEAEQFVQQTRQLNELYTSPTLLALELDISLRLSLARGEIGAAHTSLHRLDQLCAETHQDDQLSKQTFEMMAMNGRLALAAKTPSSEHLLAEVVAWLGEHKLENEDRFEYPFEGGHSILARLLVSQDKPAKALPLLERLAGAAQAEDRKGDLIDYLLLQALVMQSLGQENGAWQTLLCALNLSEPEGYCRSFVNLGPAMQALLKQLAKRRTTPYLTTLLEAFSENGCEASSGPEKLSSEAAYNAGWSEPFNERERSVLRLIAIGNSHKQIAKALQLSPNTVRWYMKNLYSKLQVHNRTEAVNRAKEVGLL
jgi:LuxR family maltose regulon positive regulatory protein